MKAGRSVKWTAMWTANWAGIAAALLLLAFDASAQGQSGPPPDRGDGAGPHRMGQSQGQDQQRQQRGRGNGNGPQGMGPARPAQVAAGDGAAPRGGQMSKEERRQLRRDVHEAGRDIYPERRQVRSGEPNRPPSGKPVPTR